MKSWSLEKFLQVCDQFKLGELTTEKPHPLTSQLSQLAKTDLESALETLHQVDIQSLRAIEDRLSNINEMAATIHLTLKEGGKIFISGCGATGRLALSIEFLWREKFQGSSLENRVVGFMAGGDVALIRSIENFEDNPDYGIRQLKECGFGGNDLLLAVTEGGETPFVIGTVQYAARHSKHMPYFLYCNPDEVLSRVAVRSKEVIENPSIKKIYFPTGPMALSGSTRMQATTVQMLSICLALFDNQDIKGAFNKFLNLLNANRPSSFLAPFIEAEAQSYSAGDFLQYKTSHFGMTVLTDTTERSPTFSLSPFENANEWSPDKLSLCYLTLTSAKDHAQGWEKLLLRKPRYLEWEDTVELTGSKRGAGFDFSLEGEHKRRERLKDKTLLPFEIDLFQKNKLLVFNFKNLNHEINVENHNSYHVHLLLKTILNIHSTLIMGRMDRYEKNVMTWVKPSNLKLIDRSIRYVIYLRKMHQLPDLPYQQLAKALFSFLPTHTEGESIVQKVFDATKG